METAAAVGKVEQWLRSLQDGLCADFETLDGAGRFKEDAWDRPGGGGGITRVMEGGAVFEKAGVNFSSVSGASLPPAATANRPALAGEPFTAMGVSLVFHPANPHVPAAHMNVRFFCAGAGPGTPDLEPGATNAAPAGPHWWFGGGMDLTPCYGYEEDAVHWHTVARAACAPLGAEAYPRFKRWCDRYFHLPHRAEARGIGGLFFDDLNEGGFDRCLAFARSVGNHFGPAYAPVVRRRAATPFGARERAFQLYRRGRYVEFNLVHDRGTLFGLQSGGRTESILMSLPPLVAWKYDWKPEPGSPEEKLYTDFLPPRDWVNGADPASMQQPQ